MRRLLSVFVCSIAAVSLMACSNASSSNTIETTTGSASTEAAPETTEKTMEITHNLGTVTVPFNPQNIAVLDLSALDTLDALGLSDRVTGIPKQSSVSYLASYNENKSIVNLGSLKEINMEELYALEPELIIIGGRLATEYENLSKIAPTISLSVDYEKGYMNSINENIMTLSSIFGLEEKAREFLTDFDSRVAALNEKVNGKTAIVGLVTSASFSTLGNTSRCSLISNEIGFDNVAAGVESTHGDSASFELILDKNPEYLFVLDRDTAINTEGAKTAIEVMENEIVKKTAAYQNNKMVYLTPDVWYLSEGGITATDLMLQDLETAIQ